jgi:hypothetical protein
MKTSAARAFSSEVDTGSREETASIEKLEPGSDSIRAGKTLRHAFACGVLARIHRLGLAAIAGFIGQAASDGMA